jgi:DNA phosphorothioation-associated putative methyltransferase
MIRPGVEVLDFGCGHGDDVRLLAAMGISSRGWDPTFARGGDLSPSDIVNLGFVLNVIEDSGERVQTLLRAWSLARRMLIVSARLANDRRGDLGQPYRDGWLTQTGTFQKYFEQSELGQWIEQVLERQPVAAGPGVFYVFLDPDRREQFLASRIRRSPNRVSVTVERFTTHRELLQPLIEFLSARGRLPDHREEQAFGPILEKLGSIRRAYRMIARVTGEAEWQQVREERAEDLLVYIALSRFDGRPRRKHLPLDLDADVRAFFGTYRKACVAGDGLLFKAGNQAAMERAFANASVGKRTPSALYVHMSALSSLPSVLRVYEGCARTLVGVVDGANIVKLHQDKPQVSYLSYPDFDTQGHPPLYSSVLVHLRSLAVSYRDYSNSENPPILHRKEQLISTGDCRHARFSALTEEEEKYGLYENTSLIGTRVGWQAVLDEKGLCISDHSVALIGSRA